MLLIMNLNLFTLTPMSSNLLLITQLLLRWWRTWLLQHFLIINLRFSFSLLSTDFHGSPSNYLIDLIHIIHMHDPIIYQIVHLVYLESNCISFILPLRQLTAQQLCLINTVNESEPVSTWHHFRSFWHRKLTNLS